MSGRSVRERAVASTFGDDSMPETEVDMGDGPKTHEAIDTELCGEPVELESGRAVVRLDAVEEMRVDDRGLVHGGFVFGLADHAAMLAVNEPTVVLTGAETTFERPVRVGDDVVAEAEVVEESGRAREVEVVAYVVDDEEERRVFGGTFQTYEPEEHVLA